MCPPHRANAADLPAFIAQKILGVFFAPVEFTPEMEYLNREAAEALDRAGIAVVLLDRDLESYPQRSEFDLVGVDNVRIGCMQAEFLLGLGCRHIEYVAVPLSAPTVDARAEGYWQACAATKSRQGKLDPPRRPGGPRVRQADRAGTAGRFRLRRRIIPAANLLAVCKSWGFPSPATSA